MHGPFPVGWVDAAEALPTHRVPCVCAENVQHVPWVPGMSAHPGGEGTMVDEEPGVVAALCESGGLRFGVDVQ